MYFFLFQRGISFGDSREAICSVATSLCISAEDLQTLAARTEHATDCVSGRDFTTIGRVVGRLENAQACDETRIVQLVTVFCTVNEIVSRG